MDYTLKDLGFDEHIQAYISEKGISEASLARVSAEHKERYKILTPAGEMEAEITGNLRFTASSRADFPAVGDWVEYIAYDKEHAIIQSIIPRKSVLSRQAVGSFGEIQILGSNIDVAFIVQAMDRDFSINRFERYLTLCHSSGVQPIILLSKKDLVSDAELEKLISQVQNRIPSVPLIAFSNKYAESLEKIREEIVAGKTYCLLGSSGTGKSSLINNLAGEGLMQTNEISEATGRGKHVTTHRQLILLDSGAIMIDTPGMREVGISDAGEGLEETFDIILEYAGNCRYQDCSHTNEAGCAVLEALETGELDSDSYENFLKLEKEKAHFNSTREERKKKEKTFGKIMKDFKKFDKRER